MFFVLRNMSKEIVLKVLSKASGLKPSELEGVVEVPKDESMGDFAFPCFILSKKLKKSPGAIANEIVSKIDKAKFEKIEAVGSYVNFYLDKSHMALELIDKIKRQREKYGGGKNYSGKLMLEFSQANTHKAFHVGHIRGTSTGESLARIAEACGMKVIRANYQGDTGMHVAKWIWCYLKYHSKEKLKKDESWIAGIYVEAVKKLSDNEKLQEEVNEINIKLDIDEDKELNELWKKTRKLSLDSLEKIYSNLNTGFDKYFFESEVEKEGKKIARELVSKKIAEISEGATIMNLKDLGLSVWVLLRSDGTVLYSAKDIALALKKFDKYKVDESLIITDSAQDLHFRQLRKTLELMKFPKVENYRHSSYGPVRFPHGKMSSRTGDNVLYSDFIKDLKDYAAKETLKREKISGKKLDERALAIAVASIKYSMLKQDMNKVLIFDKNEAMRFEGDTGPYLLYSYARAKSVLRKAKYRKGKFEIKDLNNSEKSLIVELDKFPEIVKKAYENLAPSLVANYAYSLAQKFSEFYHDCKVIGSKEEKFRLALVDCFAQVENNALSLLGIDVIEKM